MNRKQKRDQLKAARGNPDALWCDWCKHKTIHLAYKVRGDIDHYDIYCSACQGFKARLQLKDGDVDVDGRLHGTRLDEGKVGKIIG